MNTPKSVDTLFSSPFYAAVLKLFTKKKRLHRNKFFLYFFKHFENKMKLTIGRTLF